MFGKWARVGWKTQLSNRWTSNRVMGFHASKGSMPNCCHLLKKNGEVVPIVQNVCVIEHGYGGGASPLYAGEVIVKIWSASRPMTSEDVDRTLSIIPKDAGACLFSRRDRFRRRMRLGYWRTNGEASVRTIMGYCKALSLVLGRQFL